MTSNELIASIKSRALIPTSQNTFTVDDFLNFANEEISVGLLPTILQLHEEYLVYEELVPLVASKSDYPIPYRAIGSKLRNVQFQDAAGNKFDLTRLSPDDVVFFQGSGNPPGAYYIKGNLVSLVPKAPVSVTGNLLFSYFLRPSKLVKESRVATILSIDTLTGVITVNTNPSNIITGTTVDFLEVKPGHRIKSFDVSVTSVDAGANTITVDIADIPDDLAVGDMIATAGECIVPQVPAELHVIIAQRVAARCLEALGDQQGLAAANVKIQEMELKTPALIDNRVDSAPQKINNFRSPLRYGRRRRVF